MFGNVFWQDAGINIMDLKIQWFDVRDFLPQVSKGNRPRGCGLNYDVAVHVLEKCPRISAAICLL